MDSAMTLSPATLRSMSKKKPTDGNRKAKRVNIGVPENWHSVMRRLAARTKQPVLWWLIDLAAREAEQAGIETPPVPWEEDGDEE